MAKWQRRFWKCDYVTEGFRIVVSPTEGGGFISVITDAGKMFTVPYERGSGRTPYIFSLAHFVVFGDNAAVASPEEGLTYANMIREAIRQGLKSDVSIQIS